MSASAGLQAASTSVPGLAGTEYVILRAAHPTWLTLQLPREVGSLIGYDPQEVRQLRLPGRGIAFLARGPGVCRVVASYHAAGVLASEISLDRFIATARVSEKHVFSLPRAVVRHLALNVQSSGRGGNQSTDDTVIWFLPTSEYYEFRSFERAGGCTSAGPQGSAHLYIAKSRLPLPVDLRAFDRPLEVEGWNLRDPEPRGPAPPLGFPAVH